MTPNDEGFNGLKALKERVQELHQEVEGLRSWRLTQETTVARMDARCQVTHQEDERMRLRLSNLEKTAQELVIGVASSKAKLAILLTGVTIAGSTLGGLLVKFFT